VLIVMRAVEASDSYLAWAAFAALFISGLTTLVQAVRFGRIGSGHILIMGTSGAFFAVCIAAIVQGGPALMASLIVVSSLVQFLLAAKLSLLRRIFTPVVAGSVIMLIAATVMPIVFNMVDDVPAGTPSYAAPLVAVVSLAVVAGLVLRGSPAARLWAPIAALVVGCAVSAGFGIYNVQTVIDAPWIGVPFSSWPGLEVTPGVEFWALLPAFIAVTVWGPSRRWATGWRYSGCRVGVRRLRTSEWCRGA
jgi:xanthine/uracil permease